ncbi:MAG TPA: two-component regulator propeller domain-containing protein [Longimicrobiales bacterium]|nr:two-component regulator propeller domain-containing protein [Longimicrobiales bacterium]
MKRITLALLLGSAAGLGAQQLERPVIEQPRSLTQYSYQQWDDRDGLPQNSVQAMAQTSDGYLWLGTQNGIARYDGVRFRVFDASNTPAMQRGYVWALEPDDQGGLWIGTEEGGLVHFHNGRFTTYTQENGLRSNWVHALEHDRAQNLWIGTRGAGLMVRRASGRFETFDSAHGMTAKSVNAIAEDTAGVIWVATPKGLARVEGARIRFLTVPENMKGPVSAITARQGGGVYAAISGVGIALVVNDDVRLIARADSIPGQYLRSLAVDDKGALWVGASGGIARIVDKQVSTFPDGQGPQNEVASLQVDNEGSVWLGLDGGGLARMRATPVTGLGKSEGLASDMVFPVFQDRSGAVWIGTAGAGVDRFVDGKITHFTVASGHLPNDNIVSLNQSPDGAIWIGTFNGLARLKDGRSTIYQYSDGLISGLIRFIFFDKAGSVWVSSHFGVQRFMPGPPKTYTTTDGLADNFATAMLQDHNGRLWVATRSGLSHFDQANNRFITLSPAAGLPELAISSLYEDARGDMWITTGAGLARLRNGKVTRLTTREGLCSNELSSVIEDDAGRLWMGSLRGVFAINKSDVDARHTTCKLLDRAAGMRARETNGMVNPAVWRMRDGRLWFPTIRGVSIIDPHDTQLNLGVPPVQIEDVVLGKRTLEINYTGLSFVSPEQMHFRYKLDGYDADWVDAGSRRTAYYAQLKPGYYTFRVQAANAEGVWNHTGASTSFRITPFWYETWSFRLAAIAAVLTIVGLFYRRRIRALQNRQQTLVDLAEERGRAEARYRELFENATDAVFTTDVNGNFTALNKKALLLLGYDLGEALTLNIRDVLPRSEAGERVVQDWLNGRADGKERVNIINRSSERVPIEVSTRVVREGEQMIGIQAIARDVTDRAALERQLRQSQKMEAVGQLAGGVAHDFNNLLTVIRGNGELLLQEMPMEDPARSDVEQINLAAERASSLTRQLLAFSRKQIVHPRALDMNHLLRDLEKMLRRLIGEDFSILTLPSPEPACVLADPSQLEQVLVNLVVNARDAMPKGGSIMIETSIMEVDDVPQAPVRTTSGKAVVLTVADTGMGMDAATQARIFEPFFTTKETGKGTGLGLSTAYGIVQQAAGHITCSSQPGKGTMFRIYLPYTPDGTAEASPEVLVALQRGDETILVVEDEDAVRTLATRVLRHNGYKVLEARHGQDALGASRDHPGHIDLLLSDVVLPAMNGRVLSEKLVQYRPDLRVLLMSGYTDDEIVRRGLLDPGVAYLQKPFTPHALLRMVRSVLDAEMGAAAD